MAAPVRIEDVAFSDPRIELLGSIAGYNRYEALGRLAHLWRACTERETGIMSEAFVVGCLGQKGVEALIQSGLGERVPDGCCRVKGCEGRIEWLAGRRRAAKSGGEATRAKFESQRRPEAGQKGKCEGQNGKTDSQTGPSEGQTGAKVGPSEGPLTLTLTPTPTLTPTLKKKDRATTQIVLEPLPPELDTLAFSAVWREWQTHRVEIKHPLTPTSTKQQLRKLAAMGEPRAIAALRHSMANGWQGIFEPDGKQATKADATRNAFAEFLKGEQ